VHLPLSLLLIALVAFIYLYLQAGRPWLALAGLGLRLLSTPFNFMTGENLNYREIAALRSIPLLRENVSAPLGSPNPWMLVSQAGVLLLIIFVVDASVSAARRGERTIAFSVGGSIAFFMLTALGQSIMVFWAGVETPMTVSLFSLGVICVMTYAMMLDLAHGRQVAIELCEKVQEAALAADAANLGIWTRDVERDVIWASDKWRELFGFTPGESLNLDRVLQRIHPDDRVAFDNGWVHMAHDQGQYHGECRVTLPDGRTRWLAHQGRVEFDAKHRPVRIRGASIDISARKQGEQEMSRLRQDIAHVARVSVMGQLASALAHEINQPLSAILRNAEAAALFMHDGSPDLAEISAILDDIRNDDLRAGAVIDRMRTLLRRQDVEMTRLDMGQVLADVAALLRPDAVARHVKVMVDIAGDVPPVLGDRVQLQQVLLNLILNGMDALDGMSGENRCVSVSVRRDAAQAVEITVDDTGRGIAAGELERIFDPFFSTKSKGMGMGLSISRSIVEAHRGRLWAENMACGARFRFTVPSAASRAPEEASARHAAQETH